jgi:hemerythrin HHE cation binding domain-containing protein
VKRAAQLQTLSSDHHHALVLARRVARAPTIDTALVEAASALFHAEIDPHFRFEEQWLLPALERIGEGPLVERTRQEHADLRRLLAAATSGQPEHLHAFATLLERHVRFEERTLFEVAQQKLDLRTLAPRLDG